MSQSGGSGTGGPPRVSRDPIRADRVRRIDGGFVFVQHRFLRDGFYISLTRDEAALYLLLVLAGDRNGVSFYHYDSLCSLLQLDVDRYVEARNGLIDRDLVAFDGTRLQVLSLPAHPVHLEPVAVGGEPSGADQGAIRRALREDFRRARLRDAGHVDE